MLFENLFCHKLRFGRVYSILMALDRARFANELRFLKSFIEHQEWPNLMEVAVIGSSTSYRSLNFVWIAALNSVTLFKQFLIVHPQWE